MNASDNTEPTVTPEEKIAFLKRQGLREDMPAAEQEAITSHWTDADIRMAIDMNLA